jgi:DNA-directed RNA polymerase specialized sigma24 family protein
MTYPAGDDRSMSAGSFAHLLETLHADPDQAAEEYERLRRTLLKFFDWRGVPAPDECADEVFDRLARKLEDTVVRDVRKYMYGIARLVALERRRGPSFDALDDVPELPLVAAPAASEDGDRLHDCFERCLDALPEESRSLLLRYYEGERNAKISNRRRLATMLGLTENALRSRVQRLRDRLEQCVQACTAQPVGHTS